MSDETRERILSHRFWALVLGLPLVSTLVIPWMVRRDEVAALDMADSMGHIGWTLMPFVGVAFYIAALGPMPALARRGLLAFSGVSALLVGTFLLRAEQTRWYLPDPALAERPALALIVLSWILAAGFEMAMHERPRSRRISIAALIGWTLVLLTFAVPLRDSGDWDHSVYGQVMKNMERRRLDGEHFMYFGFFALILLGWLQALRRIGKDRTKAAKRFFRSSWLVYLLVPLPFIGFYVFMLSNSLGRPELFTKVHNPWSFVFAGTFGGALGFANTAVLMAGWKAPRWVRHATTAGLAGALISVLVIALLPDPRERRSVDFVRAIGEATVLGLRGEPVPERFLGGYEEFDLRAAPAALEGHAPPGAPLPIIATAVRYDARADDGRIVGWAVSMNGELRWAGDEGRSMHRAERIEHLTTVDPAIVDLVTYAFDESGACLQGLSESERATLGSAFGEDNAALDEMLCRDGVESRLIAGPTRFRGSIDRYRVVIELPNGQPMTFEGALLFDTRLWVGPPTAMAP
ncbi:MAG: hypothetical protein AB8H86_10345 [Polyangiales bacterium]